MNKNASQNSAAFTYVPFATNIYSKNLLRIALFAIGKTISCKKNTPIGAVAPMLCP